MTPALAREWRQFRLLSRDSIRRLLDTVLFSRDTDPIQFAGWAAALVATPPLVFAVRQIFMYAALRHAPPEVIERVVLGHRLFFIVYGMLTAVLVAALTWDGVLPDRNDQEIVGVLPVRPRTVVAARLAALAAVAVAFAVATSLPSGVVYAFVSGSIRDLILLPGNLAGHIVATMLGCLFVFFGLLSVRSVIRLCAGTRATGWLGTALQLVTIVLLVDVVFFLPGVLPVLVREMLTSGSWMGLLPPVWFASLYDVIAGGDGAVIARHARIAILAVTASVAIVIPLHLLPAAWIGRKALEARERGHAGAVASVIRGVAQAAIRKPTTRAMFVFAGVSLTRSRRHRLIIATYFGLAVAMIVISLLAAGFRQTQRSGARWQWAVSNLSASEPAAYVIALPMVMIFFLVLGLRASIKVPTDLDANWPFRLSPPGLASAVGATRAFLVALGVVPVLTLTLALSAAVWSVRDVLAIAAFQAASGLLLVECALYGWASVPFASAHAASTDTVKWKWAFCALALNLFAFGLADLQTLALQSTLGIGVYLVFVTFAIVAAQAIGRRRLRREPLNFDASPEGGLETLNLSEALR
jgi:hypothetical protein